MLELLKDLLGIDDDSKDTILNFYLDKAILIAQTYKNYEFTDEDINKYTNPIVELAMYCYNNKDYTGITQMTQGNRSITFNSSSVAIPSEIKQALGLPRVGVL